MISTFFIVLLVTGIAWILFIGIFGLLSSIIHPFFDKRLEKQRQDPFRTIFDERVEMLEPLRHRLKRGKISSFHYYMFLILFVIIFSYFFLGFVSMTTSWVIERHQDEIGIKILTVIITSALIFTYEKNIDHHAQSNPSFVIYPTYLGLKTSKYIILFFAFIITIYPEIMKLLWGWMPFV